MAPNDGTEPASKEDQMSAATRTAPASPDMRRAGAALGALTLAAALVIAAAFSQASSTKSQAAPAAGLAAGAHDHGWSTASSSDTLGRQELVVSGSKAGGLTYTGIPYPAAGSGQELVIRGTNGGGLKFTGIPNPAAGSSRAGGANGTRFAQ